MGQQSSWRTVEAKALPMTFVGEKVQALPSLPGTSVERCEVRLITVLPMPSGWK